jgi:hypothetical protein
MAKVKTASRPKRGRTSGRPEGARDPVQVYREKYRTILETEMDPVKLLSLIQQGRAPP